MVSSSVMRNPFSSFGCTSGHSPAKLRPATTIWNQRRSQIAECLTRLSSDSELTVGARLASSLETPCSFSIGASRCMSRNSHRPARSVSAYTSSECPRCTQQGRRREQDAPVAGYEATEVRAVSLLRVQQAVLSLRAFIVIEEIGPPHLRDFVFQSKFWSTLIDEPLGRDQGHIRCEDSLCRSCGSQVVDHVDPEMRFEAHSPDLSYELPTSLLEMTIEGGWIGRFSYRNASTGLHRPKGLNVKRQTT